jgi:ABC-type phosphate/phosphonate transport system ATPase subunit
MLISTVLLTLQGINKEVSGDTNIFLVVSTIISTIGSQLLYVVSLTGLCFQYFNLVEEKDASGLLSRIDSIGTTPEVKTSNEESY